LVLSLSATNPATIRAARSSVFDPEWIPHRHSLIEGAHEVTFGDNSILEQIEQAEC